jgi:predicted metal-dependent RNase
MQQYFFHIVNVDGVITPDWEGARFDDIENARQEAVASLRDIVAETVKSGGKVLGLGIQIADETGAVLDGITALDIVEQTIAKTG